MSLVVALVCGILAGILFLVIRESTDPGASFAEPAGRDFMAIFDPAEPLFTPGVETSFAEAERLATYRVYEIKGETPTESWVSTATGEVGFRYGTDLVVLYSEWPSGADVPARYEAMAKEWGAGYTRTIAGNPAWVVPKGSSGQGFRRVNEIYVSVDRLEIALYGQIPLEDLLDKAAALETAA